MDKRINDKITELERYLDELVSIKSSTLDEYIADFKTKAACERYAEKIIEAFVDLAFLVIKDNDFDSPESDTNAFDILSNNKIISNELACKLQQAKGMRNILAHEYGEVDDSIVFHAIDEELVKDVRDFIAAVENSRK